MHMYQIAPLALGPTLVSLSFNGAADLPRAIWLSIAVEAGFWLFAAATLLAVWRRVRQKRAAGLNGWDALESSLAEVLPRRVATLILAELRIFRTLARWIARKASLLHYWRRGAGMR